jgi:hypothetical protein
MITRFNLIFINFNCLIIIKFSKKNIGFNMTKQFLLNNLILYYLLKDLANNLI